jgi:hypothetical protein
MADDTQKLIKIENMEPTDAINALQRSGFTFHLESGMADGKSRYKVILSNILGTAEAIHENIIEALRSAYHQLMGVEATPVAQIQAEKAATTEVAPTTPAAPVETSVSVSEPAETATEGEPHTLSLGDAGISHEQA